MVPDAHNHTVAKRGPAPVAGGNRATAASGYGLWWPRATLAWGRHPAGAARLGRRTGDGGVAELGDEVAVKREIIRTVAEIRLPPARQGIAPFGRLRLEWRGCGALSGAVAPRRNADHLPGSEGRDDAVPAVGLPLPAD